MQANPPTGKARKPACHQSPGFTCAHVGPDMSAAATSRCLGLDLGVSCRAARGRIIPFFQGWACPLQQMHVASMLRPTIQFIHTSSIRTLFYRETCSFPPIQPPSHRNPGTAAAADSPPSTAAMVAHPCASTMNPASNGPAIEPPAKAILNNA